MTTETDTNQTAKRIDWVDYAKGIGIILVVVGHTLRGLQPAILSPSPIFQGIDNWIYSFHMPLFFFLSGLFAQRSASKAASKFIIGKLKTIAYPYFVWSFLQQILKIFSGQVEGDKLTALSQIWTIVYTPIDQFWFLYTLFAISVIFLIIYKTRLGINGFLLISLLLLSANLLKISFGSWWGIPYLVRTYIVYFTGGVLVANYSSLLSQLNDMKVYILSAITAFGFLVITIFTVFNWMSTIDSLDLSFLEIFLAFLGIASCICLSVILNRFKVATFLKYYGQLSLQIYVVHTIASGAFRTIINNFLQISDPRIHILGGTIVGIYIPILLYIFCEKVHFYKLFTWESPKKKPDTTVVN